MKIIAAISLIGCSAIGVGAWRALTGADALVRSFGEFSYSGAMLELMRLYCLGPAALLVVLIAAPFCSYSRRWLPVVLLTIGVMAGLTGYWNASRWSHEMGHLLFNQCGNKFANQLRISWDVGICAAVALLAIQIRAAFPPASTPS